MAETQNYNTIAAAPYQPVQAVDPTPPPPSPFGGQPGMNMQGAGNITHGGAIAGVFDNVLRGFVNGHAQGEAYKALKLKKTSDDLNNSYNADAQRLYQMSTSGVDPNSDDYKRAKSAVGGSWMALQQFRGTLINGEDDGKKKPSKKKTQQDETNPLMVLSNPASTQQEKAQAYYALSLKAGPPVYGQIAALNTPQAKQARQTADTTGQVQSLTAQNALTREKDIARRNEILTKFPDPNTMPAQEKSELDGIDRRLIATGKTTGTTRKYVSPDGKSEEWYVPGQEPDGWNAAPTGAPAKPTRAFKIGANGKPTSVMIDSKNQEIPGSENPDILPPAAMMEHVSNGFITYTDNDGNIHKVPVTRTSGVELPKPSSSSSTPAAKAPVLITQSYKGKKAPGMVETGNINLTDRPNIDNGDGTHSSTYSMSSEIDGKEVLYPGVGDGKTYPARKLTQDEALDQYQKTKKSFGTFTSPEMATAYANRMHLDQDKFGNKGQKAGAKTPKSDIIGSKGSKENEAQSIATDALQKKQKFADNFERQKDGTYLSTDASKLLSAKEFADSIDQFRVDANVKLTKLGYKIDEQGNMVSLRQSPAAATPADKKPDIPPPPPGGWPKLPPDKVRLVLDGKVVVGPRANLAKALERGAVEIE